MKKKSFRTYLLKLISNQIVPLEREYTILGVTVENGYIAIIVEVYNVPGGTVPVNIELTATGAWRNNVPAVDNYIGNAWVAGILWHVTTPDLISI